MGMIEPNPSPTYRFEPTTIGMTAPTGGAFRASTAVLKPFGDTSGAGIEAAEGRLRAILGDRLSFSESVIQNHGSLEQGYHGWAPPAAVATCGDKGEVQAVMQVCQAHGIPVVPYGAGTSVEGHLDCLERGKFHAEFPDPCPNPDPNPDPRLYHA